MIDSTYQKQTRFSALRFNFSKGKSSEMPTHYPPTPLFRPCVKKHHLRFTCEQSEWLPRETRPVVWAGETKERRKSREGLLSIPFHCGQLELMHTGEFQRKVQKICHSHCDQEVRSQYSSPFTAHYSTVKDACKRRSHSHLPCAQTMPGFLCQGEKS